mgnify:FL=1
MYKVRKSVKKIQRDKQRVEKKIQKFVVDMLCTLGTEGLKCSVKKAGKEKEAKKRLKEISEAKKRINEVVAKRKKIHKRAGKKLYKINEEITAIDKLWYPRPPIRLDLPAAENQETPL